MLQMQTTLKQVTVVFQEVKETYGTGQEAGVTIAYDALKIGIYGAERENKTKTAAGSDAVRDEFNGVWYAKYSIRSSINWLLRVLCRLRCFRNSCSSNNCC